MCVCLCLCARAKTRVPPQVVAFLLHFLLQAEEETNNSNMVTAPLRRSRFCAFWTAFLESKQTEVVQHRVVVAQSHDQIVRSEHPTVLEARLHFNMTVSSPRPRTQNARQNDSQQGGDKAHLQKASHQSWLLQFSRKSAMLRRASWHRCMQHATRAGCLGKVPRTAVLCVCAKMPLAATFAGLSRGAGP